MVGFVHFSNFLIPSEKYYNLQSFWITLYNDNNYYYDYNDTMTQ